MQIQYTHQVIYQKILGMAILLDFTIVTAL